MTRWLLCDTETTGTDPKVDRLVEVAGVVFDPELGVPLEARSMLIAGDANAAEAVNRIPAAALKQHGAWKEADALGALRAMSIGCDRLLAHSAAFDLQWLGAVLPDTMHVTCTYEDAVWPRVPGETGSLTTIALAYDVGVVRAHRALEDCLTLAAVLTRVHEIEGGLDAWLARALEPRVTLDARVTYAQRELAKQHGFRWSPERRAWWRNVRASQIDNVNFPFRTDVFVAPDDARG